MAARESVDQPLFKNINSPCSGLQETVHKVQPESDIAEDNNHMLSAITSTKKDGEYVCDICHRSFEKSIYLFRHIRKHTGDFACNKCNKVSIYLADKVS